MEIIREEGAKLLQPPLPDPPALERIHLSESTAASPWVAALPALKGTLTHLHTLSAGFDDEHAHLFLQHQPVKLRELHLAGASVAERMLLKIVRRLTSLETLHLPDNLSAPIVLPKLMPILPPSVTLVVGVINLDGGCHRHTLPERGPSALAA